MRIAIIADIHANSVALGAVLEDLRSKSPDMIYCCGDLVGYHPLANETIELVRKNNIFSVAGNHDLAVSGVESDLSEFWEVAVNAVNWTKAELSHENMAYLRDLPRTTSVHDELVLFHGSPADSDFPEMQRITDIEAADRAFAEMRKLYPNGRIGFFGHTHKPAVFINDSSQTREILIGDGTVELSRENRYLVNPGSVCLSRDSDERAAYAILETEQLCLSFHRVRFDNSGVIRAARQAGLHEPRIFRLCRRWARRIRNRLCRELGR